MKITYSERKTINLGNYESKSVKICVENTVNFENHTVETAYNEIKNFVVAKLGEALKEKPKGTVAKKVKTEPTKELETPKEEFKSAVKEMEISKDVHSNIIKDHSKEQLRSVCAAIRNFNPKYGEEIKNFMQELDIKCSILEVNDEQFLAITQFVDTILANGKIYYNTVSCKIEEESKDEWSNL